MVDGTDSFEGNVGLINEVVVSQEFMKFSYGNQSFVVTLTEVPDRMQQVMGIDRGKSSLVNLIIADTLGSEQGLIGGELFKKTEDGVTFYPSTIVNYMVDSKDGVPSDPRHTPGLIKETIAQLITQGIINEWISSSALSDGAIKTYQLLLKDPRIVGEVCRDESDPLFQYYKLRKREQASVLKSGDEAEEKIG